MQANPRDLLHSLLEYVAQQTIETDISQYVVNASAILPEAIAGLPGVSINPEKVDDEVWLEVHRLHPIPPPPLSSQEYSQFIKIGQQPTQPSSIDLENFEKNIRTALSRDAENLADVEKQSYLDNQYSKQLEQLNKAFAEYNVKWQMWANSEKLVRQSILLYDKLFSAKVGVAAADAQSEFVAGIGLIGWQLPSTGHKYVYPLITLPLEITINDEAILQVRPRDTYPRLEFDAFLAQESLVNAGEVKKNLKAQLLDGRKVSPFDISSFSDIAHAAAHHLSARGSLIEDESSPDPGETPKITFAWRFFSRARNATVIQDDVARLQAELDSGVEIPEQPLTLVTPPSNEAKEHIAISFRGRAGVEGNGSKIQELYFPLPYNREQITIIEQLSTKPGVVVQGPPGTGKTHTIANIICHYLAEGKRVLVTAEKAHVLKTLQEKIPEKLRPLVVSRVGGEQEGRRQLQSSIDDILQQLTQFMPEQVEENIKFTKARIDRAHDEMLLLDRKINEIAQAHYSDIEIDGIVQRPAKMAELFLNGIELYGWFDDVLDLNSKYAPPLTQEEARQLKNARRNVESNLPYVLAILPQSKKLLSASDIAELHEQLEKIHLLEIAQSEGKLWSLIASTKESITKIQALMPRVNEILIEIEGLNSHVVNYPWANLLREKLRQSRYATEKQALERLLPELMDLVKARSEFMERPVSMPQQIFVEPKAIAAIDRAIETGKPFGLLSIGMNSIKELISQISISSLPVQSQEEWVWIKKYVQLRDKVTSVFIRWSQFSSLLDLPQLDIEGKDIPVLLRYVEELCRVVQHTHKLATTMDGTLNVQVTQLFKMASQSEFNEFEELKELKAQLENHITKAELEKANVQIIYMQEQIASCDGELSNKFRSLLKKLGDGSPVQRVTAEYAELLGHLKLIESLQADFNLIKEYADRFKIAGGENFSKRLLNIPVGKNGDDPAIPASWKEAWNWARVKTFLEKISDRTELVELSSQRKEVEKNLAKFYEEVATQQAWLSLKKSASDKVTTALNRYKTAIQKIGKGTGKSASRYRKDAQNALLDAADTIPCWVMTHYQVSETMPAKLGLFDLIIVDEASQSTINALPVLMRGKKLLVVGDDKQVSPSNVGLKDERIKQLRDKYLDGQPHASMLTPNMSLYDMASSIYASNVMLLEHFRCHPSIINYSNHHFYDNRIRPLRISKASERLDPPLVSIFVPEGVRNKTKGQNINKAEAEAIVAEIKTLIEDRHYNGRTIGVISLLGAGQAEYIQTLAFNEIDIIELNKRDFACGEASSFQGAERDIIFLSMVATPDDCHALTRVDHEQRFNVAASRARERMYLVHSAKVEDLSKVDLRIGLINHFSKPSIIEEITLEFMLDECESEFEKDVLRELFKLDFHVIPQVPAGGFRIDMVVEGDGDARLAIECDGDSFHGPEQWPADMARQRALERAGWTFWRCFASTWKIAREETLNNLIETLKLMGIEPMRSQQAVTALAESRVWRRPEVCNEPEGAEDLDQEFVLQ